MGLFKTENELSNSFFFHLKNFSDNFFLFYKQNIFFLISFFVAKGFFVNIGICNFE